MEIRQFIKQFPEKAFQNAKAVVGEQVMLMKPKDFLTGVQIEWTDFHFSLPVMTPPPIRIGHNDYYFKQGRLLVFHPDSTALVTAAAPCREYFAITVDKDLILDTARDMTGKRELPAANLEHRYSHQLIGSIYNFQQEALNISDPCPLMLQSVSLQLVIQIIRETARNNGLREGTVPDKSYAERAADYMKAYYDANITLEDICAEIHVSKYHFIRLFKENTGRTPHEYLLGIRLSKARQLLETGECSIAEAAKLCGFVNAGHFSAAFKRFVGMPPSVYRKTYTMLPGQGNT